MKYISVIISLDYLVNKEIEGDEFKQVIEDSIEIGVEIIQILHKRKIIAGRILRNKTRDLEKLKNVSYVVSDFPGINNEN